MVRKFVCFAALVSLGWAVGCGASVVDNGSSASGSGGGVDSASSVSSSDESGGGTAGEPGGGAPYPTPCSFLRGTATLTSWNGGNEASYEASAFSFEFASHAEKITHNDYDVLYEDDTFVVNTVVDDKSFIVDLGAVAPEAAPATVDPKDYGSGTFGMHDFVQAVVGHGYWVRTKDSDTEQVAVFQVTELAPGQSVTIGWMRSLDPDSFVPPVKCP